MKNCSFIKTDLAVGRFARRFAWPLGLGSLTIATTLWLIHVWMTYRYPPYANPTDEWLWLVASIFRAIAICCLPLMFLLTFRGLRRSEKFALKLTVILSAFGLVGIGLLHFFRNDLSMILNNEWIRLYPSTTDALVAQVWRYFDLEKNVARVQSGWVLVEESLGLIFFVAGFVWIGRLRSPLFIRSLLAWLWIPVGSLIVILVCGLFVPIFLNSYDFFLLGMFFPLLLLDCISIPFNTDPSSTIMLPSFLVFSLVLWRTSRSRR